MVREEMEKEEDCRRGGVGCWWSGGVWPHCVSEGMVELSMVALCCGTGVRRREQGGVRTEKENENEKGGKES
jgi:hypothetical protein